MRKFILVFVFLTFAASGIFAQKQSPVAAQSGELDDNGVPVLIKHLPDWENAQKRANLAANLSDLQKLSGNRPILNEIEFAGGTEAVTATYEKARLVIVEFPTPQLAIDTDAKIQAKLAEINQPPTNVAYRKTGNYAVFVFDAPEEAAANNLLDDVTYEKNIQWLGDSPFPNIILERKERAELLTTGDILVTVFKTSGLAILAALGFGGLFGALVFYHRRRQQSGNNAYSDAGGMLRLNLDDMTSQADPSRLLENK